MMENRNHYEYKKLGKKKVDCMSNHHMERKEYNIHDTFNKNEQEVDGRAEEYQERRIYYATRRLDSVTVLSLLSSSLAGKTNPFS